MRVYERIRTYINDHNLQQAVIACRAGIPDSVFQKLMCGEQTLYADDLRAICLALNVSPELFTEDRCSPQG